MSDVEKTMNLALTLLSLKILWFELSFVMLIQLLDDVTLASSWYLYSISKGAQAATSVIY